MSSALKEPRSLSTIEQYFHYSANMQSSGDAGIGGGGCTRQAGDGAGGRAAEGDPAGRQSADAARAAKRAAGQVSRARGAGRFRARCPAAVLHCRPGRATTGAFAMWPRQTSPQDHLFRHTNMFDV